LGLAPKEVRENDIITILYKCNFLIILYLNRGYYFIIREYYINRVIDSELIKAKDSREY
jgi:hypothetical protein